MRTAIDPFFVLTMKKRIRFHQLRVGMFVEEAEVSSGSQSTQRISRLLTNDADITSLMAAHAMSVVIDTRKGVDVDSGKPLSNVFDETAFQNLLASRFSASQIKQARRTIERSRPHVHAVLNGARLQGVFRVDAAGQAVEHVMLETFDNPGALIGVAKLKATDEGTFLHSLAVSALMMTFGRSLGMDDRAVRQLGLGGLIHDLGKMALPVSLLQKPGKLSDTEYALIRTHPVRGRDLVGRIAGLPESVLDICLSHHEKFDGSGYPHGLAGRKIPLAARIAAICDVYEALTTIRPYKRAWTQAEAVDLMLRSHNQFDPELLKAFVSGLIIKGTIM